MAREYKDSGIEWIGEIPKEWKTISFTNSIVRMSTGLNPRDNFELTKDDEYFYVTIKNFKDGKIYLDENCDRISKEAWEIIQERSQLQKGDILFASISKDGQAYILEDAPSNWNINESVFCIRVNPEYFYDRYFYYHIIDSEYYNDLRLDATGTTFQSIKQNKLRKSVLCIPNKDVQQKIADYLDKVCGEVDELISLQERMIEDLKVYKQSVITEAVTKGLNPKAPMRDSDIDWIGEVPEHWEIIKMKRCVDSIGDVDHYMPDSVDAGIPYIMTRDLADRTSIIKKELCKQISNEDYAILSRKISIERNDVIFARYASIGNVCFVDTDDDMIVSYSCVVIKPSFILDGLYLFYYLKSKTFEEEVLQFVNTNIQGNVGIDSLYKTKMMVPPLKEQRAIASYLDTKCSEIDSLIALKQTKIEELKEYKKSVIYEYVTGKKEVV
ncbi:MAG: restriction endonuclease subunit S [Bacteroidaceae bacterium]|nr:restriction endonuclease subunit S [Bacteroidaceae bacterium]